MSSEEKEESTSEIIDKETNNDKDRKQSKESLFPSLFTLTKRAGLSFWKHRKTLLTLGLIQLIIAGIIRTVLFQQPVQAGIYIGMVGIFGLLSYMWTIRHMENGETIDVRDAFYVGTAPIVKFLLLLILIVLQLIPFSIGAVIFATGSVGQAVNLVDIGFLSIIWAALAIPSFYWITSSVIGLFIATLPRMRPFEALQKAKELVDGRRMKLFGHIIYLMILSLILLVGLLVATAFLPNSFLELSLLGTTFFTVQIVQYLVTTLFVVPFVTLYLFKVYKLLVEGKNEERRNQKAD